MLLYICPLLCLLRYAAVYFALSLTCLLARLLLLFIIMPGTLNLTLSQDSQGCTRSTLYRVLTAN
jgi:hypothetical protein